MIFFKIWNDLINIFYLLITTLIIYKLLEAIKKLFSDERLFPIPYDFSFGGGDNLNQNQISFESNYVKTSKYTWYNFLPSKK